ncbi:MAG: hypothetical protein KDE27_20850 [Planctomycetes bacterium]|nr:hypothetical protein [Planctomycetota bacterium]
MFDLDRIRTILLIGDPVPLPASAAVIDAVQGIEVTSDAGGGDGFRLTLALARSPLLDYELVQNGTFRPGKRVIIGVMLGIVPEVLIDGIVTQQQLQPSNEPGRATLTVMGSDVSVVLSYEERNATYPNQPDSIIFTQIIARYAQYGLVPAPSPTADFPIELERTPRQQDTDLAFIHCMAERNGYKFYVEPVTFGVNSAYFGPEVRAGVPQPALSVDLGAATNVSSLSFSHDALAPVGVSGSFVDPFLKQSWPIPALPSLKVPPLALAPATPLRTRIARETAKQNAGTAAISMLAQSSNSPDAVTGNGTLDSKRYGHALRARGLVGVRGAGLSYDGLYYVQRVTHSLRAGEYTQSFSISREGHLPTLPVIPT